jgi:glycosyltransferase involved in cell wall biosynthesis
MQYLDRPDARRGYFGDYFDGFGLDSEPVRQIHSGNPLSVAQSMRQGSRDHPLVTVIMTTWNAARTVAFAAESVLRQSCGNVELIIVDDASSDDTGRILKALEAADSRIRVLFNERNHGTYFSKNRAIEMARGEFITCHDSDDWMHPQHIEKHLAAAQGGVVASVSKWIRMDPSGRVVVRRGGTYLHENPASTFFHRSVVSRVGYFDSVRAAADSEFAARIRANYGPAAVAELDLPLAIGLQHEASLTAAGATAFDEHRHSAVRLRYCEAWLRWHIDCLRDRRPLYLPFPQTERAFEAPAEMTSS